MKKIDFKNLPDKTTPINADNLNLLQDNIEESINEVDTKIMQHLFELNIDDIKETGNYEIFNAKGTLPTGFNTNDNNIIIQNLMRDEEYGRQILYDVRSHLIYTRSLRNFQWYEWYQIQLI